MKFVVEAYADVPLKFKALDGNVAETCETFNVAELPEQIGALGEIFVFNGQGDDFVKRLSNLIPLARMASREEYRAAVQFLCSDASGYMNGQNIVIDGGRSIW
jgi:NAD(P)-dependent dehydrogenase (short-subunit alcohol dehydrogenase family)